MVTPLTEGTMPAVSTWRCNSERLNRDSGRPNVAGSSQARALTWATTRGGKGRGPASAGKILQPRQPFSEEAFAPFAHHRAGHIQTLPDLLIFEAISSEKNKLRTHDVSIR
jgi:hypothetical protein